jgi:hypothetical protein
VPPADIPRFGRPSFSSLSPLFSTTQITITKRRTSPSKQIGRRNGFACGYALCYRRGIGGCWRECRPQWPHASTSRRRYRPPRKRNRFAFASRKPSIRGVAADLSTREGAGAFIAQVPAAGILINNLGIFEPKPFFEIPDEDWERFFQVNVMSAVRLSRHHTSKMVKRFGDASSSCQAKRVFALPPKWSVTA